MVDMKHLFDRFGPTNRVAPEGYTFSADPQSRIPSKLIPHPPRGS